MQHHAAGGGVAGRRQVRVPGVGVLATQPRHRRADRPALRQPERKVDAVHEDHDPAGDVLGRRELEGLDRGSAAARELFLYHPERGVVQAVPGRRPGWRGRHEAPGGCDRRRRGDARPADHDMAIPQARLLSTIKRGATGSYPFGGGAQAEFKLTDSTTSALLAAGVDRRIGGGSISTAAQWQWGDAENAMTAWARLAAQRLSSWAKGTAKAS